MANSECAGIWSVQRVCAAGERDSRKAWSAAYRSPPRHRRREIASPSVYSHNCLPMGVGGSWILHVCVRVCVCVCWKNKDKETSRGALTVRGTLHSGTMNTDSRLLWVWSPMSTAAPAPLPPTIRSSLTDGSSLGQMMRVRMGDFTRISPEIGVLLWSSTKRYTSN